MWEAFCCLCMVLEIAAAGVLCSRILNLLVLLAESAYVYWRVLLQQLLFQQDVLCQRREVVGGGCISYGAW